MEEDRPKAIILSPTGSDYQPIRQMVTSVLNENKVTPISYEQTFPISFAREIDKADFVIADVSGANANVMYEVGYAQVFRSSFSSPL